MEHTNNLDKCGCYNNICTRDCLHDLVLSNQISGDTKDVINSVNSSSRSNADLISQGTLNSIGSTERYGLNSMNNINSVASKVCDTRDAVRSEGRLTEKSFCDTRDTIYRSSNDINNNINRVNDNMFIKFQDTALKLCEIERQASDNTAKLRLENCKNTADIQLEAQKNKSELCEQLARCCCEIKALVKDENTETRALFRDSDINRLRDDLAKERQQNLLMQIQSGQSNVQGDN